MLARCFFAFVVSLAATATIQVVSTPARTDSREAAPVPVIESRARTSLDQRRNDGDPIAGGFEVSAATDTTVLGRWTFDNLGSCDAEGWTSVDLWQQIGTFFHVDDFTGISGSFGGLLPLQGDRSMWCGTRPDASVPLCGYATLPGYGNQWEQTLATTACLDANGDVTVEYLGNWDTEPGYDFVYVEYDTCNGVWGEVARYDGAGSAYALHTIPAATYGNHLRVRFRVSTDWSWSDEDGLWDSDGAFIVDSLTVSDSDSVRIATETFESEAVGDTITVSGQWMAGRVAPYGDFAGLYKGLPLVQEDPCRNEPSCLWAFINGSSFNYACGSYPLQAAVPRTNGRHQSIQNEVWSPPVALSGSGSAVVLAFDVYRDLAFDGLVFYRWRLRSWTAGCPGPWRTRESVYYGDSKDWHRSVQEVGDLIDHGATGVQVALAVRDMCYVWCGILGSGSCHSHAPLFDNVELLRVNSEGPRWSVRSINLFQDTFAADGTLSGTARADAARDIMPADVASIRPGDSVVVNVSDFVNGLSGDGMSFFGPAVYAYVSVLPPNQPGKIASGLVDDGFRWPVVDSYTAGGTTWYAVRMDSSFSDGIARTGWVENQFCVDLNDNLFTPGDTIRYFFGARSGVTAKMSFWSEFTGTTPDIDAAAADPMEFTILPAGGWQRGGNILYVDGFDGFGAQPLFDWAFMTTGLYELVDRYDIRAPDALAGNRPGARVADVAQQLAGVYRVIVWNTGDLVQGLIGDGTGSPEKSDDAGVLTAFLDLLPENGGVYLTGNNIASELANLAGPSAGGLRNYIDYTVTTNNHYAYPGFATTSPLVTGRPGSCFEGVTGVDSFLVYGGCPTIAAFDVIQPAGPATLEMAYDNDVTRGAALAQQTTNAQGMTASVMLEGFSFDAISNIWPRGTMDRYIHMTRVLNWMGIVTPVPTGAGATAPLPNSLAQNYPNPFNPVTTITYTLRERSPVRLRIYNVAGQLVRTLVDDVRAGGVVHAAQWDGRNDAGQSVSSGVYFYKLTSNNFTQTRKMVLLK